MSAQEAIRDDGVVVQPVPHLTLAPGAMLDSQPAEDLGIPQPGIIELAPEFPLAPNMVPRHQPTEIAEWMARKAVGQRAADRRLSEHHTDSTLAEREEAIATPPERYTRGKGTRPSSKEVVEALGVLSWHSKTVHPWNKRQR